MTSVVPRKTVFALLLVLTWCLAGVAVAEPRVMNAVDLVELSRPSSPMPSPDGRWIVYLRSNTDWVANKSTRQLYLLDRRSGNRRPLFDKSEPQETHRPVRWSPDSRSVVTVLKRKGDTHKQVYRYTLESGELRRLTSDRADVRKVWWTQDGLGVLALTHVPEAAAPTDWHIEPFGTRPRSRVVQLELASGRVTPVVDGDFHVRSFYPSRDGSVYLYSRAAHGDIDRPGAELWLREVDGGQERRLTHNAFNERHAKLSPDNRQVAYLATVNAQGDQYYEDNVFVASVATGKHKLLLPKVPMEITAFDWSADGSALFLIGNTGLRSELYRYTFASGDLDRLTQGDHVVAHWRYEPVGDQHVFVLRDAHQPGELYTLQSDGALRRLTTDQASVEAQFLLPRQEAVTWRGRGGVTLEGLLIYPVGAASSTPFPLVTISHGGPRSSSQFGSWNVSRYVPVLSGLGYGVFLPNYRGGHGYGDKFARSMVGNYFRHAHHDVMDGVDHLIDAGLADPERLVKMGWSAGGHMTNKLITSTDRFKAASSGAGAADWISMYAESDVRYNRTPWFGGAPWQKRAPLKSYIEQSLLKDAWRITTPTLFWSGDRDVRVPPTQSIMMYRGAKAAGADTRLYLAPKQPHNFQKPSYKLFKINTELEWFARHLGLDAYTPVYPPAFYNKPPASESIDAN